MKGYYSLIIEILKKNGFSYLRPGKGSHEIWVKDRISVSVPFNCYSKYTANGIMKDAGVKHHF
jgi:predicted RNA binding protein YcfA (HicA-like mRNA interferase family)